MSLVVSTSPSVWIKRRFTIAASATVTVDSFAMTSFDSADYVCHVQDVSDTLSKSFYFRAHQKAGSSLKDSLYGKMGDSISINVNTAVNSGDYELNITNNEAFSVEFSFARLKIF